MSMKLDEKCLWSPLRRAEYSTMRATAPGLKCSRFSSLHLVPMNSACC